MTGCAKDGLITQRVAVLPPTASCRVVSDVLKRRPHDSTEETGSSPLLRRCHYADGRPDNDALTTIRVASTGHTVTHKPQPTHASRS